MELCPLRRRGGRSEFDASTAEVTGRTRRLVSANLEHDLATLPAARDSLERRPGLRERKNRVDLRASRPCTNSACQAVSPPIGRAAASTWLSRKGFGASTSAGTTAYSAATPSRSKGVSAYTSSPLPTTTPESS